MDSLENYFLLFTDSLTSNLAVSSHDEIIIHTAKMFNYPPLYVIIFCSTAYGISILLNYLFGRVCYNILAPFTDDSSKVRIHKFYIWLHKYQFFILPISVVPFFGKFVIVLAGFSKLRLKLVFSIGLIVKIFYYSWFMSF